MVFNCSEARSSKYRQLGSSSHMRSFVKIKPRGMENSFCSFTDISKSTSRNILHRYELFVKIKFSRKFSNLQYICQWLDNVDIIGSKYIM